MSEIKISYTFTAGDAASELIAESNEAVLTWQFHTGVTQWGAYGPESTVWDLRDLCSDEARELAELAHALATGDIVLVDDSDYREREFAELESAAHGLGIDVDVLQVIASWQGLGYAVSLEPGEVWRAHKRAKRGLGL